MTPELVPGFSWSISKLETFETCPKRLYHLQIAKDVKDPKNDVALWGDWLHRMFAKRLKLGTPLPETIRGHESKLAAIASAPGEKLVETKLAMDRNLRPTEYFSKTVWVRSIMDVGIIGARKAWVFDWKTGNPKEDNGQLALSAATVMAHRPEIEEVTTAYVWLKTDSSEQETYTRADLSAIWQAFMPRLTRMERAYQKAEFPAKPSGLCRKHCPIPNHVCEFSGT